jgi:uncharacterized protein (DUF983 family)
MTDIAPLAQAALLCRCPRCGTGPLFHNLLSVRPACAACGLDLSANDTGDGPAALVILLLGAIIVGMAFYVEFHYSPPLWVHAILWPVVTVPLAIVMIRVLKAGLIWSQYRNLGNRAGT